MSETGRPHSYVFRQLIEHLAVVSHGHFFDMPTHDTRRTKPVDYLLIWVIAGRGSASTEGAHVHAQPGSLLTFVSGKPHHYKSDTEKPWNIFWVHFKGHLAATLMSAMRGPDDRPFHDLGLDADLRDAFERFRQSSIGLSYRTHRPAVSRENLLGGTRLISLLGQIIARLDERREGITQSDARGLFKPMKIQQYVADHLEHPIQLETLAALTHLSRAHFCRVFQAYFGVSPMRYVAEQKMAKAASLLSETNMPIKQICDAVGYSDPYYFSRLFRKQIGQSPRAYRNAMRKQMVDA